MMFKILVALALFLTVASAQCDTDGMTACFQAYSEAVIQGVGDVFNLQTGLCNLVRNMLVCVIDKCPLLAEQEQFAASIEQISQTCGFVIGEVDPNLKSCALFGDPHVRSFDGSFFDCDLKLGEVVFADADNSITVESDSDVTWTDQSLTAVRSVTIANSRSGKSYTFIAGGAAFTPATENDLVVNTNSFIDTVTKTRVRVAAFGNANEAWLNVYIRTTSDTRTGVCETKSCPLTPAKRNMLVPRAAECDSLEGNFLTACNADVAGAGADYAQSSLDASVDEELYKSESGNFSTSLAFNGLLLAIVAFTTLMFA